MGRHTGVLYNLLNATKSDGLANQWDPSHQAYSIVLISRWAAGQICEIASRIDSVILQYYEDFDK